MEHSERFRAEIDSIRPDLDPRDTRLATASKMRLSAGVACALVWAGMLVDLTVFSFLPDHPASAILTWRFLLPLVVTVWCFLDGRVLAKEPSKLGLFGIFFAPPVGYVIYCFWSRGAGGFVPVFIALLPVIAVVVALATVGTMAPAIP